MRHHSAHKGFALIIAIITTSLLLLVSFVVVNISVKQLVLASDAQQSQYAFYASDSGIECALYWDTHNPVSSNAISAFDVTTPGTITCNGQTISTGSENNTVPTYPTQSSVIGGASTSIFFVTFTNGCAIVKVTKGSNTVIESRGYNTCNLSASRRFERGITITY